MKEIAETFWVAVRRTIQEHHKLIRQEGMLCSEGPRLNMHFWLNPKHFLKTEFSRTGQTVKTFCCVEGISLLTESSPELNLEPTQGEPVNEPVDRKKWASASGEVYNSYFCASLNNRMIRGLCRFRWAAHGKSLEQRKRLPIVNLLGPECFTPSSLTPSLSTSKYLPLLKPACLPDCLAEEESLRGCAHDALSVTTARLLSSHDTCLEQICWCSRAEISYLSIT